MSTSQQSLLVGVQPLPSRKADSCCSRCGQKLPKVFKHALSKGLVSILWKMYHAGKPSALTELNLTNSEFANAQKLGYFRLAQSVDGKWAITDRGLSFLSNKIEVERYVHTKTGRVVEREGTIKVSQVDEGWWSRLQYAQEARRA